MLVYAIGTVVYHPLRMYETFLITALCLSPAWLFYGYYFSKAEHYAVTRRTRFYNLMVAYAGGLFGIVGLVFILNGAMDDSPEQTCTGVVISKHIEKGRHGSRSYHADVPLCTESLLPHEMFGMSLEPLKIDKTEEVTLAESQYNTLMPGQDHDIIIYKKGRYGIPWKVSSRIAERDRSF